MAGGGGSEPNLTPFIDLFSVLVCFLLMTAAWLQLESVQVQVEKAPSPSTSTVDVPPPPDKDEKKVRLSVFLYPDRVAAKENDNEQVIPNLPNQKGFDESKLKNLLSEWKRRHPEKTDVVLNTEAHVTYGEMIRLYDLLISQKWPDVGISPN